MAIASSSGAQFFIGPVNSVADDHTAYVALTPYVEVKEIESMGEFGDTAATITFTSLADARVHKRKGVRDAGDMSIVVGNDPLDAGQLAMVAAQTTSFSNAFKVILQDGADANDTDSTFFFRAFTASTRLNVGAANNIIKRTFAVLIDSQIIERPSLSVP